jgi:lipopolysaccharide biosynthesis protein
MGPDVAILCHYEPTGSVRPDIVRYIRELKGAGFSVVLVSNSGSLMPDAMTQLRDSGVRVLIRRNFGLDFSAWRMALRALNLPRPDTNRVLLVNDSVYGPLVPLAPLLARMTPGAADLWGLTDSQERGWHVQSYFLLAGPALLRSPVWRRFWQGVIPLPSKRWMVGRYEIGLSRRVTAAGFQAKALFPHTALIQDGSVRNPTLSAWRELLDAGFPFLKRELLRDNPLGEAALHEWRRRVPAAFVAEIDHDLRLSP